MPRRSTDAIAAALWREQLVPPKPPRGISRPAAAVWREIVASKPAHWFNPGAQVLLRQFWELSVLQQELLTRRHAMAAIANPEEQDDAAEGRMERRLHRNAATLATLATKLRLSVQAAVDRRSATLDQGGRPHDRLLGGKARLPR